MELYEIGPLFRAYIEKRPSQYCRSPYVADINILCLDEPFIAHAPALGCCGYADKGKYVYVSIHEKPKLCTHVIHLAHIEEKNTSYLIGMHPKSAEKIVEQCLRIGCINSLENNSHIEREKTFLNSRFDFVLRDKDNKITIIEVKSVPCGDYEDISHKERKKKDYSNYDVRSKIAYFPDGYRKNQKDPVSPRALKHVKELQIIKQENPDYRCILIFVVQRNDCVSFQPSILDEQYRNAVYEAYHTGVEIIPIQVHWEVKETKGLCFYDKILSLNI